MTVFRVNFGQGQVHGAFTSYGEADRFIAMCDEPRGGLYVQRYVPPRDCEDNFDLWVRAKKE